MAFRERSTRSGRTCRACRNPARAGHRGNSGPCCAGNPLSAPACRRRVHRRCAVHNADREWWRALGPSIENEKTSAYLLEAENGATLLTIPVGHTLAALRDVLGDIAEVSTVIATRRREVRALDTGRMLPMTAPDQVLASGRLVGGGPISIHYRGGSARDEGLMWYIHGSEGDIRVTAPSGHAQMEQLTIEASQGEERRFRSLQVPAAERLGWPDDVVSGNVARVYARMAEDLRSGTRTAPDFQDAVELHRLLAALETSAHKGCRIAPGTINRILPERN